MSRCSASTRLASPPAWREGWISPFSHGHLQAVGTDDAGRRQYLYHPASRARRDAEKFDRMVSFGQALTSARSMVLADLGQPGMPLGRACAAAIRLIDLGYSGSTTTSTPTPTEVSG